MDTVNSMTVAELMGKRHDNLMRTIRTELNKGIVPGISEWFIPGTRIDGKGQSRDCFEVTFQGCEYLGKRLKEDERWEFIEACKLRVMGNKPLEKEYTMEEAAEILGVSRRTIGRRIASGELKAEERPFEQVIVQKRFMIPESSLNAYKEGLCTSGS